ncbi:FAD-dependent oxidoreductase [Halosimplex salinum]|uniref:FAD-dependent oxidoreductase n=1 Tax=Halosimplex salinum TaxID=1710538 RepID=UPI000F4AA48D|nr:FAD-dependent oxidoreductase [Halosimplex salinum]
MEDTEVTVVAVESVGEDAVAIDFETPDGFAARPGQFVKVALEGVEESRFYTISSPDVRETFEITVGIDPEGEVGPELAELEAGDTVEVSGPFGNAYYEDEEHVLILAGGPGVGPAIGIAERALDDGGEAAIVYQDGAPIHDERLTALSERGVSVAVLAPESPLESSVADVLTDDTQVFVYGFAEFLDDATSAIATAGGEPDAAKVENFG